MEGFYGVVDDVGRNFASSLRLYDLTVSGFSLSTEQLNLLADYGKAQAFPPSKVALLVSNDLAFGLSRMFNVFREDDISEHSVFSDEQRAREWLAGPD